MTRKQMRCSRVLRLLNPFMDGELDDCAQRMVADHVAECERCQSELLLARNLWESVGTALQETPNPPPWLPARIEAGVTASQGRLRQRLVAFGWRFARPLAAATVAASILFGCTLGALLAGGVVGEQRADDQRVASMAKGVEGSLEAAMIAEFFGNESHALTGTGLGLVWECK